MLEPTEFRARPGERPGARGEHAHDVPLSRNDVRLRAELRHPEVVDHIGRREVELDRNARREVELVRRHRAVRVAELEPPLVPDDGDRDRLLEAPEGRPLTDLAQGHEAQSEHDREQRERDRGPGDLEGPMTVDLRRLASRVAIADREDEERQEDAGEDDRRDDADDEREEHDRIEGGRHRAHGTHERCAAQVGTPAEGRPDGAR